MFANNTTLATIESNLQLLPVYMEDYINDLVEQYKYKIVFMHYFRWHGIALTKRTGMKGFPSFGHWKFNGTYKRMKEEYDMPPFFFS